MQKSKTKDLNREHIEKFQKAQRLQQTGHLNEAEKTYQEILTDIPNNPDCIHFLGLLFFQKGDLDKAEINYKKSIELAKNPTYLNNYALLAYYKKDYKSAIDLLLESIKLKSDNAEAWYNLGCIYSDTGELNNSEDAYKRVIQYNSKHIKALFNLLCVQENLDKTEDAKKTIDLIMAFKPSSPDQYHSLAIAISRLNIQDNMQLAIDYLRQAISENPNSIEAYRALATLHVERNSTEKAKEIYEQIIKKESNFQQINLEYANCLAKTGELEKASKIFNEILKNDKNNLIALNGIANNHRLVGNFQEAEKIYQDIIKRDSNNIVAYSGLSNCSKFSDKNADVIKNMEKIILKKPDVTGYFALGKIYDDLKIFEKAIDYYRKGNHLRNKRVKFNEEQYKKRINSIIKIFDKSFITKIQTEDNLPIKPIFILGAPRSGSTLVEQILSSHAKVFGGGELGYIKHIASGKYSDNVKTKLYPERFLDNTDEDLSFVRNDAETYLNKVQQFIDDKNIIIITDKMPGNYEYLGYIFSMFPNCKVINTKRDPIDTCLSIFFQNFHSGHKYAFDLDNLVIWYKEYDRLMNHWLSLFDEKILTVNYESIINNTEEIVRDIISYCNLEWQDECLQFHKSKRTINTASNWQVKQPIYKTSNQRWKNYEKFIPELIDGLSEFIRD